MAKCGKKFDGNVCTMEKGHDGPAHIDESTQSSCFDDSLAEPEHLDVTEFLEPLVEPEEAGLV